MIAIGSSSHLWVSGLVCRNMPTRLAMNSVWTVPSMPMKPGLRVSARKKTPAAYWRDLALLGNVCRSRYCSGVSAR